MRASYSIPDASSAPRMDADALFAAFSSHLGDSGDIDAAIDRLLADGAEAGGRSFEGARALADRAREAIRELYARYSLDGVLDGAPGPGLGRRDEVERFRRHFGEQFRGPCAPGFAETLDLLDRFTALRELEKALRDRDLDGLEGLVSSGRASLAGIDLGAAVSALGEAKRLLVESGYVVERAGGAALSSAGARRLGALALREILGGLDPGAAGAHETRRRGPGETLLEESRPWQHGDPMHLDAAATLRASFLRRCGGSRGDGTGRVLEAADLHVHETSRSTRTSTVLLLDMSWSMSWEGRFAAARKVALALETLMRRRPRDWFGIVGFYTRAVELQPRDLAEVTWNAGDPYTNLQDALGLGARLLDRHPAPTRQMLLVTDGQPTAYFQGGRLFCEWPMGAAAAASGAVTHTLAEVQRVTRKGIRINTFMLDDDPNLRSFVQRMTAINRGRAFYTRPDDLGRFVLVDHPGRRRRAL